MLGALVLFGAAACGLTLDFGDRDQNGGSTSDAGPRDNEEDAGERDGGVRPGCLEYLPFEAPRKLAVSTDEIEWSPAISSDGLELLFVRTGDNPITGVRRAVRASRSADFATDELLELDLSFQPDNPSFSTDGTTLFFDGFPDETFVWAVDRRAVGAAFGPERVVLVAPADPWIAAGPDVSSDGMSLLLGSQSIYVAQRNADGLFAVVSEPIPELGDPEETEGWPAWGPGGSILFKRENDLWLATPSAGSFTLAPITELNDPETEESDPDMTPDGRTIVFMRRSPGPDLWIADRACAR